MKHGKRYTNGDISVFEPFETSISSGDSKIDKRLYALFKINIYGEPLNSDGRIAGGRPPGFYRHKIPRRT